MIVFTGDWVKAESQWKQVVAIDYGKDLFAILNSDGELQWWDSEAPELLEDHISNTQMQAKLKECGL